MCIEAIHEKNTIGLISVAAGEINFSNFMCFLYMAILRNYCT